MEKSQSTGLGSQRNLLSSHSSNSSNYDIPTPERADTQNNFFLETGQELRKIPSLSFLWHKHTSTKLSAAAAGLSGRAAAEGTCSHGQAARAFPGKGHLLSPRREPFLECSGCRAGGTERCQRSGDLHHFPSGKQNRVVQGTRAASGARKVAMGIDCFVLGVLLGFLSHCCKQAEEKKALNTSRSHFTGCQVVLH